MIRVSLDNFRASLDRQRETSKCDLDLLTSGEKRAYKILRRLVTHDGTNWNFSQLDNMQMVYLRALYRKATDEINLNSPTSPEDRTDFGYLEKINVESFDAENIDPCG